MEHIINLKELRQHVAKYAKHVGHGHSFIVTKRSHPLFRLMPIAEEGLETVVDFTKFCKNGISVQELIKRLKK